MAHFEGGHPVYQDLPSLQMEQDSLPISCGTSAGFTCPTPPFITGPPTLEGFTVILTSVERFSKMTNLLLLPKLPSAKETAQLVLLHVVGLHSLPNNVVSYQGTSSLQLSGRSFAGY